MVINYKSDNKSGVFLSQDSNAVPTEYVLQPITTKLPYYSDFTKENEEMHKNAKRQWWQTFEAFQRLFRATVRIAGDRGRLTEKEMHKYFCSGLYRLPRLATGVKEIFAVVFHFYSVSAVHLYVLYHIFIFIFIILFI